MLFMAVVLPVIAEGMAVASHAGTVAERSRVAAQLADRVLTEMAVTADWQDGEQSGDFEPDYHGYRWSLTTDDWSEGAMRTLTVEVTYSVQGRDSSVKLSTLAPESEL